MTGRRRLIVLVSLPFILAAIGFATFQLQQELGEAERGPCGKDEYGFDPCPRDPLAPTPVCDYDETGVARNQQPGCPPISKCPTCPIPTVVPAPTKAPLIRNNPAAVLSSPPVHRVGDAVALGRSDCPAGWQADVSDTTGMSICFPADAGRVTSHESGMTDAVTGVVRYEDRIEITLSGSNLPAVAVINVLRSAGMSGPFDLDCPQPESTRIGDSPAKSCVWPEGKEGDVGEAGVVPWFISAHLIDRAGYQWVFHGVIWGVVGHPTGDTSSLKGSISQVLSTLRLP